MIETLGRYEIQEKIGQGGFAIVYRAYDRELERPVALKELRSILLSDTNWVKRFRQEARAIARLDHPHIITIHDIWNADERQFIVMRLVDGPGLDELITERGGLPWSEAVEIMTAVAAGLDYAHSQGILHRDLKPANILMDPERGPLLTDFGFAKLAGEHSMSMSGDIVGTPHYIAPEAWEGQRATAQVDIYALGCILHELLTGEKLFKGETPPTVMLAHFKPPELPDEWPGDVPPAVSSILSKALARNPANRYASAGELASELMALENQQPPEAESVPAQVSSPASQKTKEITGPEQPDRQQAEPEPPAPAPPPAQAVPPAPSAPPQPSMYPPQPQPPPGKKGRSGCFRTTIAIGVVLGLLIIGVAVFCSVLGGTVETVIQTVAGNIFPEIEIGETRTEEIFIPPPDNGDPVSLSLNTDAGKLLVAPGATEALVEGTVTYNVDLLKPEVMRSGSDISLEAESGVGPVLGALRGDIENTWDLKLADIPLELDINAGPAESDIELGGLSVLNLDIVQGAANFNLSFSEANQVEMDTLEFRGGASEATLAGLANATVRDVIFQAGGGSFTLDFGGDLRNDINVSIEGGLGSMTVVVPESTRAKVSVTGQEVTVRERGAWRQADGGYRLAGAAGADHQISINVELNSGRLDLRN